MTKDEAITMRELRRDNARLIDAIDDILTAYFHSENAIKAARDLANAMQAARELIEDMGPEAPRE